MKNLITVFILLFSFANAQVFKGKLGKYNILMLKDEYKTLYSYSGKLVGIPLIGKSFSKLCEPKAGYKKLEDEQKPKLFACFYGKLQDGIYKGEWRKIGSKSGLKFELKEIKPPTEKNKYGDKYTSEEFYYDLIKKTITFKPNSKVKLKGVLKTTTTTEKTTQITRSRVFLADKKVQKAINKELDEIHKNEVMQQIWCVDGSEHLTLKDLRDEVGDDMTVEYYKKPFLLLSYSGSISCEGAHPNNYYDQYLFDLNSGEVVVLEDMFNIYDAKREHTNLKFKEIVSKYLEEDAKDCYSKDANYQSFALYPAKGKKLAVRLQGMGHAMFACETEPIAYIPIKELKSLAKKEAFKYFDFKD